MMPVTTSHAVFVLSFASAFFACYFTSRFLGSVLNTAGYDISGTILGHEKQPENMPSQLVKDFSSNHLAQLVTIALAAVTSIAIFWKFSQSEFALAYVCAKRDEAVSVSRVEETSVGSPELARIPPHKKDHHLAEHCYVSRYAVTLLAFV